MVLVKELEEVRIRILSLVQRADLGVVKVLEEEMGGIDNDD